MSLIKIRKAVMEELEEIVDIYKSVIVKMNRDGIHQWDETYPNRDVLREDILKDDMLIGEVNGEIASILVVNKEYDTDYNKVNWISKSSDFIIIHRLCVNPVFQGLGIGKKVMNMIEEKAIKNHIQSIRLDTFELNTYALRMYKDLGYEKVGEANWRKGKFIILEKILFK